MAIVKPISWVMGGLNAIMYVSSASGAQESSRLSHNTCSVSTGSQVSAASLCSLVSVLKIRPGGRIR